MTYMATPQHKNPWPGGHEIYNFGKPFFGYHLLHTWFVWSMPGSKEDNFFKKYSNFTLFTPKLPPFTVRDHKIYNFVSSYPTYATHQTCLRLAQ